MNKKIYNRLSRYSAVINLENWKQRVFSWQEFIDLIEELIEIRDFYNINLLDI